MDDMTLVDEKQSKGCGPKPLAEVETCASWSIDRITDFVVEQNDGIDERERRLTPCYWRLGMALSHARKYFNRGQWGQYLKSLNIDKTRASKSQAIFRTFKSEDDVDGLTVEQAYSQRERTCRKGTAPNGRSMLHEYFDRILSEAEDMIRMTALLESSDAAELLPECQQALDRLTEIDRQLQRNADSC
jgi:hypothetical protein